MELTPETLRPTYRRRTIIGLATVAFLALGTPLRMSPELSLTPTETFISSEAPEAWHAVGGRTDEPRHNDRYGTRKPLTPAIVIPGVLTSAFDISRKTTS